MWLLSALVGSRSPEAQGVLTRTLSDLCSFLQVFSCSSPWSTVLTLISSSLFVFFRPPFFRSFETPFLLVPFDLCCFLQGFSVSFSRTSVHSRTFCMMFALGQAFPVSFTWKPIYSCTLLALFCFIQDFPFNFIIPNTLLTFTFTLSRVNAFLNLLVFFSSAHNTRSLVISSRTRPFPITRTSLLVSI